MTASWRVKGRYFEACNCDAICPCRMVRGVPGGRSTEGECYGVLCWAVDEGRAEGADLGGRRAAMIFRYDDDEPASPWSFVLHVDDDALEPQRDALVRVLTGALGGETVLRQPWVRKPSTLLGVRSSRIEFSGGRHDRHVRVGSGIEVEASEIVDAANVRCIVPGYDQPGVELRAHVNRVDDEPFGWSIAGKCAFAARFDYFG